MFGERVPPSKVECPVPERKCVTLDTFAARTLVTRDTLILTSTRTCATHRCDLVSTWNGDHWC